MNRPDRSPSIHYHWQPIKITEKLQVNRNEFYQLSNVELLNIICIKKTMEVIRYHPAPSVPQC